MQMLGVYWKIQDICYHMGTEIFQIEKEMTEKKNDIFLRHPVYTYNLGKQAMSIIITSFVSQGA